MAGQRDVTNNSQAPWSHDVPHVEVVRDESDAAGCGICPRVPPSGPPGGLAAPSGGGGEQREPRDTQYTLVSAPRVRRPLMASVFNVSVIIINLNLILFLFLSVFRYFVSYLLLHLIFIL